MRNFTDYVLESWDESFDFEGHTFVRNITAGKSEVFPIIGRKRDAGEHVPGEIILGGKVDHNEREISLDAVTFDSAFIAEIDELMAHYPLSQPYARQLGQSLASLSNSRIARAMINGSRQATGLGGLNGHPAPGFYYDANVRTDPAKLEEAAFKGIEYIRTNDIGGGNVIYWLPWQQQLLLARYTGIDTEATSGSGNRAAGTVGQLAGLNVRGTNSIPKTNVTTGRAKYQGDFTSTVGVISNPMSVGTLRRRGIRVTMTNQEDRLGTLLIASKLEGHDWLRPECAFEVTTDDRLP
ncbi:major capsid protein [Brucella intermedia]|uniref:hypothetical protein n=1 Tax=Brucella intermedia TaxID=94625 RepID=UPI00224A5E63|nr:hypothetical protein [Brucella intermedia]